MIDLTESSFDVEFDHEDWTCDCEECGCDSMFACLFDLTQCDACADEHRQDILDGVMDCYRESIGMPTKRIEVDGTTIEWTEFDYGDHC